MTTRRRRSHRIPECLRIVGRALLSCLQDSKIGSLCHWCSLNNCFFCCSSCHYSWTKRSRLCRLSEVSVWSTTVLKTVSSTAMEVLPKPPIRVLKNDLKILECLQSRQLEEPSPTSEEAAVTRFRFVSFCCSRCRFTSITFMRNLVGIASNNIIQIVR